KKIPTVFGKSGQLAWFNADVLNYSDYYPFGMLVPNRFGSSTAYRYGFQGQEKDDEIKGEGNSLNYTFRMHDPRIGRFFARDPLFRKFPELTPYQFSSNTPIMAVELEGLETSKDPNKKGKVKKETGDCEGCKVIGLEAGDFGSDVQNQVYTAKFENVTKEAFENLKAKFVANPGNLNDNGWADYELIDRDGSGGVSVGDHVDIDIAGPDNASVLVEKVSASGAGFNAKFTTLEGHTDAGSITFTATYDEKSKTLIYVINNTTRANTGLSIVTLGVSVGASRSAQQQQWKVVMSNVGDILGLEPSSVTRTISEYDYNDWTNKIGKLEYTQSKSILKDVKYFMKDKRKGFSGGFGGGGFSGGGAGGSWKGLGSGGGFGGGGASSRY
ncbi:RHS repeat domain-containing protein, partial [Flavobacterium sp.]|uniref:RHS repeat domain-containing protein n=1 Tax=Flavobacterium sp. TaxID=239 RepID=UPI003D6AD9AF